MCIGVIIADARLQGGREAPVGRRPTAVHEHKDSRNIGARLRGQVYHSPDHLMRSRPATKDAVRGVDALPRLDYLRPDAGEGDDAPRTPLGHVPSEIADQTKGSLEIQLDHLVELLVGDLQQW